MNSDFSRLTGDLRSAATRIAAQVYAERAARCTAAERRAAREFIDRRNGAGFGEELRIDGFTMACQRKVSVDVEGDGFDEAGFNACAWVCAAIERGLAVIDFGGGEAYRVPRRREV